VPGPLASLKSQPRSTKHAIPVAVVTPFEIDTIRNRDILTRSDVLSTKGLRLDRRANANYPLEAIRTLFDTVDFKRKAGRWWPQPLLFCRILREELDVGGSTGNVELNSKDRPLNPRSCLVGLI
jgi:hypothetical protein